MPPKGRRVFPKSVQHEHVPVSQVKKGDVRLWDDFYPDQKNPLLHFASGPCVRYPDSPEFVPMYYAQLYNPVPGHYSEYYDDPIRGDSRSFVTGRPAALGPQIRKVGKHRSARDDPRPSTRVGQLVHDLKRIVPGGDPRTNSFYSNSVAMAIEQGVAQTASQAEAQRMNRLSIRDA